MRLITKLKPETWFYSSKQLHYNIKQSSNMQANNQVDNHNTELKTFKSEIELKTRKKGVEETEWMNSEATTLKNANAVFESLD